MTRKRFIKLLMSHGVSRNAAVEIATASNSRNIPYERAYELIKGLFASVRILSPIRVFGIYLTGRC